MHINQRIIQIVAIAHIIGGLLLPFAGKFEPLAELLVGEMFAGIALSDQAHSQAAYVIALFGPTVASWGILMLIASNSYFAAPTRAKWYGLMCAVLVWFIGDTTYSLLHGVSAILLLNVLAALALLTPLCLSRKLAE